PQRTYTQDGVCLTESGLSQLQSLSATASRRKRPKPKLKLKIINQNSVAVLQTPPDPQAELSRDEDLEDSREADLLLDCEGKSESSPEREPRDEERKGGAEGGDGAKKRKRKPYRPGIGGFMVRQRSRTGQGKAKRSLSRKDSSGSVSENVMAKEEGGWSEVRPDTPLTEAPPGLESLEKEAFFGKELLDRSKQVKQALEAGLSDDDRAQAHSKPPSAATSFLDPSSDPLLSAATTPISTKPGALASSEDPLADLSEVLNTDDDILGMLSDDLVKPGDDSGLGLCPFQVENSPSPFAGLDIGPIPDDSVNTPQPQSGRAQRTLPVEPLDGILSPELDKMVTDGAILSKLYKIPELEGKDVEDLFTAVLSPSNAQPPQMPHPPPPTAMPAAQGPPMPLPNPGDGMFPRIPMMNGMMAPTSHFPQPPMGPGAPPGPCAPNNFPAMQRFPFSDNMRDKPFNQMRGEVGVPWTGHAPTPSPVPVPIPVPGPLPTPMPEGETDTMSNAQRSTLKWEKEETLGELATVAPVLYTNQKARDNRAALRINKVQMSNETMKRQQQQQQQQTPDLFDPSIPLDSDLLFKDPLKNKESEHEQEWKFRQPTTPKEGFSRLQLPGNPTSAPSDDVFVRPQPPPPAVTRTSGPDACYQGQPPQTPPQSSQMFSPSSSTSRPSSPWDPYAKMVGTPRPPPAGSSTPRRSPAGPPSPANDPFGSPSSASSDPYAKPPDTPRPATGADLFVKPMGPPRSSPAPEPQGRHVIGSPTGDPFARPTLRAEAYQRMSHNRMILSDPYSRPLLTPIPGSNESGSVPLFKTPMPPPQSQDSFGSMPSTPRRSPVDHFEKPGFSQNDQGGDPYAHPPLTPRPSMNDGLPNPPRMGRHPQATPFSAPLPMGRHPSRDPYAQAPGTPRPDYSQQAADPYAQPPGTPRPSSDPYAQPPGTPRPSSDPYAQPPGTPRPAPDPYSQQPCTPRPAAVDQYPQPPSNRRPSPSHPIDPYAHQPGTPRPTKSDPYAHPPGTPRPGPPHQDQFARPAAPGSQTPKHPGMADDSFAQPQSNQPGQTPIHDPYEQAPMTPRPQSGERLSHDAKDQPGLGHECGASGMGQFQNIPQSTGNVPDAQNSGVQPPLADTEEKLRQRQRLRELILRQQQQKSAIRQEKGLQDPPMPQAQGVPGTPRHWSQEDPTSQGELFSRPPPPYPGTMRGPSLAPGGQRFPGSFPNDQRGPFPPENQFPRPQFPGDVPNMGLRPHGARFGFPPGGQEHFLRPPHPMQGPVMDMTPQMRRSLSGDLGRSMGGNPPGLPQHFPSRGLPMQQHNIMGQPFIELRHRAPESRLRLPFGPPAMGPGGGHLQRPPRFGDGTGQEALFSGNPGNRIAGDPMGVGQPPGMGNQLQMSSSLENLHQHPGLMATGPPHPPLMRSLSHPATTESFSMAPPSLLPPATPAPPPVQADEIPNTAAEVMEKLDTDDSAVKDLEDVERALSEKRNTSSAQRAAPAGGKTATMPEQGLIKQEGAVSSEPANPSNMDLSTKTEVKEGLSHSMESSSCGKQTSERAESRMEGPEAAQPCASAMSDPSPVLSGLLGPEKLGDAGMVPPACGNQLAPVAQANPVIGLQQSNGMPMTDHLMNPSLRMDPSFGQGVALANPDFPHGQPPCQNFGVPGPQPEQSLPLPRSLPAQAQQQTPFPQPLASLSQQQGGQNRPLLLEEQPLLLQDLLDQERQEQQQQRQMQAMIRQRSSDTFFPNIDFDAITDPIMKAKMVALKGINKVMAQNSMGMAPIVMNRVQLSGQQGPAAQCPEAGAVPPQAIGPDGKLAPHIVKPQPPNFGPGFPKEDLEQLKHVTEQQSVVQKQLEQIRKQQKEHAELIEEYRVKQQQCGIQPSIMPGVRPPGAMMPGAPPQGGAMMPGAPPIGQPMMGHMMQMQPHQMGQPAPPHMPGAPGWQPGAPGPMGGPRMPPHLPQQMPLVNPAAQPVQPALPGQMPMPGNKPPPPLPAVSAGNGNGNGGGTPHVKFDDNNPFSEGFQERERKERLREQQERQRVQLMQEVERQRALQQRLELEQQQQQQGMMGADAHANRVGYYNPDMPHDFMQPQRPPPPQQQQMGQMFQQPGFMGLSSGAPFMQGGERRPMQGNRPFCPEMGPGFGHRHPMMPGPGFGPGQPRPAGFSGPGMLPQGGGEGQPFSMEPATPLPPNYPGSGQSLIQLYSNIIPEEKGKKKRNRKKKKDEDAESVKTPSTPHSDLTAPLTPCVSDTSSTPTRSAAPLGEHDPPEQGSDLERQLSVGSGASGPGLSELPDKILSKIKLEKGEHSECRGPRDPKLEGPTGVGTVKVEEGKEGASPLPSGQSPAHSGTKGEPGNELLKHLLKNKGGPPAAPPADRQDEGPADGRALQKHAPMAAGAPGFPQSGNHEGSVLADQSKKKQRNKRAPKSTEKPPSRYKKRKKEEEERQMQLSLLPLMEPMIGVSFTHFPPYGSGQLNGESRLSGSFGSASLDGVSDYYSQLIYKHVCGHCCAPSFMCSLKQNNLSNPPTPPASLPPTPPPVARQKMVNGFATTEELARKAAVMGGHDVTKSLMPKQLQTPFRPEDLLARAIAQGPKTVDEHCEDRDTPDSFIPSSSPESVVGMEISRYPDLSLVKEEPPSPAPSPVIPLLPSSMGKGSEAWQRGVKMEPQGVFFGSQFGQPPNCSKTGLVSIAITLNPAAAENIPGVVAAVADLLCVKIPGSYEVSSAPDRNSLAMLSGLKGPPPLGFDPRHPTAFPGPGAGPQGMMRFLRPPGMIWARSGETTQWGRETLTSKLDGAVTAKWWFWEMEFGSQPEISPLLP
ncbi:hypothetical protein JZ751_008217, partial [Albula glossodonta]